MVSAKSILLTAMLTCFFVLTGNTIVGNEVENVIILANAEDHKSIEIAEYYAEKRGIPKANIIALPMPKKETISVREFVDSVHNPLLDILENKGWLRIVIRKESDILGRKRVLAGLHHISYLVTIRGVPLRIENDPALLDADFDQLPKQFRVNNGSVDSELALLIEPANLPMAGFVTNPLFVNEAPTNVNARRIIRVSRLDGPNVACVKNIVDRSLQAEITGLIGRAYFDLGGPYAIGDTWIGTAGKLAKDAFFDVDVETTKELLGEVDRYDAPAIYMGWYRQHAYGPWSKPRWAVPSGAIGFHLHSFSATTLRSTTNGWLGAFINQGYCATVGNVYEPYIEYTHRPDILLDTLLKGHTFGEAVMRSNPVLSWQGVAVGDPLYTPFKINLDTQLQHASDNPLSTYIIIREINRLEATGQGDKALQFAKTHFNQKPSLPLIYKLVNMYTERGKPEKAIETLKILSAVDTLAIDEIMLVKKIADFLKNHEDYESALSLYKLLNRQKNLSTDQQILLFAHGAEIALKLGESTLYSKWKFAAENCK